MKLVAQQIGEAKANVNPELVANSTTTPTPPPPTPTPTVQTEKDNPGQVRD